MEYESDLEVGLSGAAAVGVTYAYLGSGTALDFSGIAAVGGTYLYLEGGTPFDLGGTADVSTDFFSAAGTGRFFFTGGANVFVDTAFHIASATGGFAATGSISTSATGDQDVGGGPALGGSALAKAVDTEEFGVGWRSRRIQTDEFDFGWQTGARPYSWYRVTGGTGPSQCPQSPYPPLIIPNWVVNILARNVGEVCGKVRDRNFPGKIEKIEQFSTPAFRSQWGEDTDPTANCLTDVTPDLNNTDCVDLLIDYLPVQRAGWVGLYLPVYEFEGGGVVVSLGGEAVPRVRPVHAMTSGPVLSGSSADIVCTAWRHESDGVLGFVGDVCGDGTNTVVLQAWSHDMFGSVSPGADAEVTFFSWGWESSGAIAFAGAWPAVQGWNRTSDGATSLSGFGSLDVGVAPEASGTASISGEAEAAFPAHAYDAGGGMSISGVASFLSSSYDVQASGGLSVQGGESYVPLGSFTLGGSAGTFATASPSGLGGPAFGGEAGVVPSVRVSDLVVGLTGSARAYTDDLGTFVSTGGWGAAASDTRYVFRYQPAEPFSDVTTRVLSRCCVNTLPLIISVDHQLAATTVFGQFLARNGLDLPSRVGIRYNRPMDLWHQTLHFTGYAAAYPLTESWDVAFTLKCLGRIEGAAVTNAFLEFGLLVKNHGSDGRERVTRFRVQYDSDTFCSPNKSLLNFPFLLDVRKSAVSPRSRGDLVLQDEIGLYRGPVFQRNPRVRFKLSDNAADPVQGTVDIGPAIAAALAAV